MSALMLLPRGMWRIASLLGMMIDDVKIISTVVDPLAFRGAVAVVAA
jgi:hypothetical protein